MQDFLYFYCKNLAFMIRYKSRKQLTIEEFKTPFERNLAKDNRWVKLAALIPWDELARVYYSKMSQDRGAPCIDARIVIGALIVKHKQGLDDRETIEYIRENPYVQYFLGFSNFINEPPFDRSLFTRIRERMGIKEFDSLNVIVIKKYKELNNGGKGSFKKKSSGSCSSGGNSSGGGNTNSRSNSSRWVDSLSGSVEGGSGKSKGFGKGGANMEKGEVEAVAGSNSELPKNKGKLILDATVCEQQISYPTDLSLLNKSREETERLIDILHRLGCSKKKPRTYRRIAKGSYLRIAKKRRKGKSELRKGIKQQLNYLRRNIKSIHKQLDNFTGEGFPLSYRDQKLFWVIQEVYRQQLEMYKERRHRCSDRIVNLYQPHVRPIVRGKEGVDVEFGAKLGVSMEDGFVRINTFSWNAYNESSDLKKQVESYKELHGYYPEVVIADSIYGSRENRSWLKRRNIRFSGKALGRPSKTELSAYQKRKQRDERRMRNQIEGKFGQGKNGYNLNKIRARQPRTSESWISCIFFVMNLVRLYKIIYETLGNFLFAFFKLVIIWSILDKDTIFGSEIFKYRALKLKY